MSTVDYFEKLLAVHGDSERSLDWSKEGQTKRFEVLGQFASSDNCSVLDVGCGLGHFADVIDNKGNCSQYIGMDASTKLIDTARTCRGWADFLVRDVLEDSNALPEADYIVSSGMLNVVDPYEKQPHYKQMTKLLMKCFDSCKIGCAVNMLSTYATSQRRDRHYYNPVNILTIALEMTPRVAIRHDYLPNDFTVILYK